MTELERVTKIIDWLIFEGYIENRRDLAVKMGYTESSLSQIINGKVSLSQKFIKKLSIINDKINYEWLQNGVGDMLNISNVDSKVPQNEVMRNSVPYEFVQSIFEDQKARNDREMELIRQNGELIEIIKKQINHG